MKKKITVLVLCIVALILPTIIAIISYINAQSNPINSNSVSHIKVKMPNGDEREGMRSDKAGVGLIESFVDLTDGASDIKKLPNPENDYKRFDVDFLSYNKEHKYTYFITENVENSFYRDDNGKYYKVSKKSAERFLSCDYAIYLYENAMPPVLSVGATGKILPTSEKWSYRGYGDKFYNAPANKTDKTDTVCDVSGGLELSFDREPNSISVVLSKDGEVVFEDSYELLDSTYFENNTKYKVTVSAKWYEDTDNLDYYGEQVYNFTANVLSPAEFYLSDSSVEYGKFVVVSAKNIIDPSQIGFYSTPSIDFEPTFYEFGGLYHALIPLSLDCMEANNSARKYTFTFTYGGVEQNVNVDVKKASWENNGYRAYMTNSEENLNNLRNDTTLKEFENTVRAPLASSCNTLYWAQDGFIMSPVESNKIKYGYAIKIILQNLKGAPSYRHEGVDFNASSGENVRACLSGKVIYVGETTYMGKTVIIDHGAGLKSLYSHMSSVNCSVGDVVQKGETIGIVGSTGLCYKKNTVHFGLYVFDVPVRYNDYETEGINFSGAILRLLYK